MDIMMMIFCPALMLLLTNTEVWSLEEPQPEIYLQPRNFNPHPYEVDASSKTAPARGPILFPPSPPPETEGSNFIKIDNSRISPHPVDSHPYPKLVRKHKYRIPGRHQEYENQINPRISKALAGHAKKVLGHSKYSDPDSSSSNEQKNYAFSYKVVDHLTGDDFSHTQSQNEKATSGEYRVKLPDGRVQIVSYTADKNGYKADVKYQDVDVSQERPQHRNNGAGKGGRVGSYGNTEFGVDVGGKYTFDQRGGEVGVTAQSSVDIHENREQDYDYGHRNGNGVYAHFPTSSPLIFAVTQPTVQNYQSTPSPNYNYDDALETNHQIQPQVPHRFQFIPHNKVQIVNQGALAFSSTVAPSYLENQGIIFSTPAPQFSNDYPHVLLKSLHGAYGRK